MGSGEAAGHSPRSKNSRSPTGSAASDKDTSPAAGDESRRDSETASDLGEEEQDGPETVGDEILDVDSNETDSTLGLSTPGSSTRSVNSTIYEHVEEHGRTYNRYKHGKYFLPNDEFEQNRLDLQHHLFVMGLHGRLHLAPITTGIHNALDIATGTGIWAIEFAKYPSAMVIGTDLSPIQPIYVPPNCRFEVDDAEDDWVYSHKFDYIHGRYLLSCFNDFESVVAKAYEHLEPGGYFELQDSLFITCLDDTWKGSSIQEWTTAIAAGAKNLGKDWLKVQHYKRWLQEAGFEDVVEHEMAFPTNTWPKDKHHKQLGVWYNQNILDGIHGMSMAVLTKGLGYTTPEVELLLVGLRKDLCDRNIHCYAPQRIVYGRKPL